MDSSLPPPQSGCPVPCPVLPGLGMLWRIPWGWGPGAGAGQWKSRWLLLQEEENRVPSLGEGLRRLEKDFNSISHVHTLPPFLSPQAHKHAQTPIFNTLKSMYTRTYAVIFITFDVDC